MSPYAAEPAHTPVDVLLCDDHAVVRAGLLALLSSAPGIEVIGEAASGEEAVALAAALRPDVVLMDLQLGSGIDGVEATRRIARPEDPGSPHVLVLTTYDTDADIARALDAGAAGHLLKAERPEELFAAIRAAAEGRSTPAAPVAHRVLAQMRSPRPTLTDRELDILHAARPRAEHPRDRPCARHQRGHGQNAAGPALRQARCELTDRRGLRRQGASTGALTGRHRTHRTHRTHRKHRKHRKHGTHRTADSHRVTPSRCDRRRLLPLPPFPGSATNGLPDRGRAHAAP